MANLYERLTGQGLDIEDPDGDKIGIHAFTAALYEYGLGKITAQQFIAFFGLTTAQTNQAVTLYSLLTAAPDKQRMLRVLKNWLYLAEADTNSAFVTQSAFVARLQDEVTDQGGTLP